MGKVLLLLLRHLALSIVFRATCNAGSSHSPPQYDLPSSPWSLYDERLYFGLDVDSSVSYMGGDCYDMSINQHHHTGENNDETSHSLSAEHLTPSCPGRIVNTEISAKDNVDYLKSNATAPSTTSSSQTTGQNFTFMPKSESYVGRFPPLSWQNGIRKDKLDYLHQRLTASWPKNLDPNTKISWESRISKYLNARPKIVQRLLNNDPIVWAKFLSWTFPDSMILRERRYNKGQKKIIGNYQATYTWLIGKMTKFEKTELFARLSTYWGGISDAAIQSRIGRYVELYGPITSLEPLLNKDETSFQHAADLIFISPEGKRKAIKHPDAGESDILHRNDQLQDGLAERRVSKVKQKRLSAARYTSGEAWMHTLSADEIDQVHHAVSSHWIDDLDRRKRHSNLLLVNRLLQKQDVLLKRIQAGDDRAAWQVAAATAAKNLEMKDPFRGGNEAATSETDHVDSADYSCWSMQYLDSFSSLGPPEDNQTQHMPSLQGPSTMSQPEYMAISPWEHLAQEDETSSASTSSRKNWTVFSYGSWQRSYDQFTVQQAYDAVTIDWPRDMDKKTRQFCDRYLSQLLTKQERIREALMAGDNAVIKEIARNSMPDKVLARCKGSRAINHDTGVSHADTKANPSLWFHGHITPAEHRKVISSLAEYWSVTHVVATKRLQQYALTHGLVTSPEPLLCNDIQVFAQAADLIFDKDTYRKRNLKSFEFMGSDDELHQPSEHFGNESGGPFFFYYDQWEMKPYSQRYSSHEWHRTVTLSSIKAIHLAIVNHWVPWLERAYINKRLDKTNKILQDNPQYIQSILEGDSDVTFAVARASVESDQLMRQYNRQYQEIIIYHRFPQRSPSFPENIE